MRTALPEPDPRKDREFPERLTQGDGSTPKQYGGTELGLVSSRSDSVALLKRDRLAIIYAPLRP